MKSVRKHLGGVLNAAKQAEQFGIFMLHKP